MEILVGTLISLMTAGLGAWFGYHLASKQSKRARTADFAFEMFAGKESEKRVDTLNKFRRLKGDETEITEAAKINSSRHQDLRRSIVELMNRYSILCNLYLKGDLDKGIFNEYMKQTISDDYQELDSFLNALEKDFAARNIPDRRPFFPDIAAVTPRQTK